MLALDRVNIEHWGGKCDGRIHQLSSPMIRRRRVLLRLPARSCLPGVFSNPQSGHVTVGRKLVRYTGTRAEERASNMSSALRTSDGLDGVIETTQMIPPASGHPALPALLAEAKIKIIAFRADRRGTHHQTVIFA